MRKWSNQHKRSRNSYPPAPGALLDNNQKAHLCILAREAYDSLGTTFLPFDDWRQMEQEKPVGKDSLRDCTQADYKKLVGHFLHLKGESGRALNAFMEGAVEEKKLALFKLDESLAERGLLRAYAETICKSQNQQRGLEEVSAARIWLINFTVRNRRKPLPESTLPQTADCPF